MRWLYKTTSQNFDVKETRLNDHMCSDREPSGLTLSSIGLSLVAFKLAFSMRFSVAV
jgi:hypothetical protein